MKEPAQAGAGRRPAGPAVPPALVLAAGLGTRARPLTRFRAKAAMPVAGEPLIRRILRFLAGAGVRDVVVNLHHLPSTITGIVGDGTGTGVSVRYSWEVPLLGSAGGPRHALPLLGAPRFLIVNGDTLTDVDLAALVEAHARHGALVTMAVVPNPAPERYGGVVADDHGLVRGFTRPGDGTPSYHFIGAQMADADAFAVLPDNVPDESVGHVYRELLVAHPGSVRAHVTTAAFFDIGTPAEYLATSLAIDARERTAGALVGTRSHIAPGAVLTSSVLWDDVNVGPGARLARCIVGDRVTIPAGAQFEACVIVAVDGGPVEPGEHRQGDLVIRPL